MKPTGLLHLGNYVGALKNWAKLQDEYEAYYMIADLHSLTSNQAQYKEETTEYIYNMVVDWLCAGLDPKRSVLFIQSDVPEHCELFSLFSMITPVSWLERNPTYKEQMQEIKGKDLDNVGFLAYPVLQAADIAVYQANRVPVGKDQLPHLEITREIIRRFHHIYKCRVLVEPEPILGEVTKLNGLDGRKMSKSYENAIYLSDDAETVRKKVMSMVTDIKRVKRTDPGHPDECNLFPYYLAFKNEEEFIGQIRNDCTSASMGCVDCKKKLVAALEEFFAEFREKRAELINDKDYINDVLNDGTMRAGKTAKETMLKVREAVGMDCKRRY
jgi:tryptophanyl-tRNA synthetase